MGVPDVIELGRLVGNEIDDIVSCNFFKYYRICCIKIKQYAFI